jgi:hypothetical protein
MTITTSTFDVKFKENNENDMTFVVWAGTRRRSLARCVKPSDDLMIYNFPKAF